METEKYITHSEEETITLGRKFAGMLKPGDIVQLKGDLGAGKTEFVKGICSYFDVEEIVSSPTFTIINQYFGIFDEEEFPIYHIDLYRIKNNDDLREIGFEECLYSENSLKIIEWPEKSDGVIPQSGFIVEIKAVDGNENVRDIFISSLSRDN